MILIIFFLTLETIISMKNNFILCGFAGWCLEIIWTGICSLVKKDYKLTCNTSFWMFPIYGLGSFIGIVSTHIRRIPVLIRGLIYASAIYITEYVTGSLLKKHNVCPWDYSNAKLNYKGLIRLDFAPLWFIVGLLFEKITNFNSNQS